jgi:hypothetical protein
MAIYIKVFNILNGFRLKLKAKTKVLKKRGSFIIKGLIKAFYKIIYLGQV